MTKRLYYQASTLREFEARVVRLQPGEGNRIQVVLDQTAFYPTSGGQPHDLGTLDDIAVVDVFEDEQGEVIHVLERAPVGERVQGRVDWPRRFDHMQQHTGQHLLSAAFVRLFKLPTVSFHLGREVCTIDLETSSLSRRQLQAAEELANQVVFEDRAVHIRFMGGDLVSEAELRRAPASREELRLIEIEEFDRCPCGGTHVACTGQIGLLLVRSSEKIKQQVRVEFVCGGRALAAARADHQHLSEAARLLTTGAAELPDVLRKQGEERRAADKERARLLERLAEHEARALLREAEAVGGRRILLKVFPEADGGYLRLLAARLVKESGVQVLFASRGEPSALVFAQSPGLETDMNALLRAAVQKLGGKGGGSCDFAQGSVSGGTALEEALREASQLLRR